MGLTLYHLGISQSERVVWLCEELGLDYALHVYARDPQTKLAPTDLKSMSGNLVGTAPLLHDDGGVSLAESGAIVQYILAKHNPQGRLQLPPSHPDFPHYLEWFQYANGNMQTAMMMLVFVRLATADKDESQIRDGAEQRVHRMLKGIDDRLAGNEYLAGKEFTAADIMNVFALTTMRYFAPVSLKGYSNILRYLKQISGREGYKRAMEKGDPGLELLLGAEAPAKSLLEK